MHGVTRRFKQKISLCGISMGNYAAGAGIQKFPWAVLDDAGADGRSVFRIDLTAVVYLLECPRNLHSGGVEALLGQDQCGRVAVRIDPQWQGLLANNHEASRALALET